PTTSTTRTCAPTTSPPGGTSSTGPTPRPASSAPRPRPPGSSSPPDTPHDPDPGPHDAPRGRRADRGPSRPGRGLRPGARAAARAERGRERPGLEVAEQVRALVEEVHVEVHRRRVEL